MCATECIDSRLKSRSPGVICKIDMERVYNHIIWGFLVYMLKRMGLGPNGEGGYGGVLSLLISVLVNGVLAGHFTSSSGLRQGYLISPSFLGSSRSCRRDY